MDDYSALLGILDLSFHHPKLLRQAFTHRSYLNESKQNLQSNERLEFLGDAILSFVMSAYLFKLKPDDEEGDLTNLRSYIVKTKSLAEAADKLHLGEYLLLSKGEDATGGRNNPQLMANTYESVIGAIFLDQGLEAATKTFTQTLLPLFQKELANGPPKDSKSELQEVVQERAKESPQYKILGTHGPDHAKQFTVGVFIKNKQLGQGVGNSKQEAEETAAKQALEKLTQL